MLNLVGFGMQRKQNARSDPEPLDQRGYGNGKVALQLKDNFINILYSGS